MISDDDPVTVWLDQLRDADDSAASNLWHHFMRRLYESARHKIRPETRRVYDAEDAAQSAFHSVCAGIAAGRFPDLCDREGLWRLLLVITSRKVIRRHRYDQQQRRDVRRTVHESIFVPCTESASGGIEQLVSQEPTPEFAAEFVEVCDSLFQNLDDPALREVATLRLEGHADDEVAERLGCSRRTVQRRMEVIRRKWKRLEPGHE